MQALGRRYLGGRVEETPSGAWRIAGLIRCSHGDAHIATLQISGGALIQQGERRRSPKGRVAA
jgi:hypothetical protein